jgi:hypothetical protein
METHRESETEGRQGASESNQRANQKQGVGNGVPERIGLRNGCVAQLDR